MLTKLFESEHQCQQVCLLDTIYNTIVLDLDGGDDVIFSTIAIFVSWDKIDGEELLFYIHYDDDESHWLLLIISNINSMKTNGSRRR